MSLIDLPAADPVEMTPVEPAVAPNAVRRVKSEDLLQHLRELEIDHEGRIYRLRVTQLNKLILTA